VSVEAISWALNLASVPADGRGGPSSACKFVLVGLANHAGPDGTGAFPSVATLVRYTGLSERTVRTCLDRLEAEGIITPCDPDIVAARIKRADRRPQGWDLNLTRGRDELGEPGEAERTSQRACRQTLLAERLGRVRDDVPDGVQPLHPAVSPVDNYAGVQPLHPATGPGCNWRATEVQPAQARGATAAPEPYIEPSTEPSAATASLREPIPRRDDVGGRPVADFFAALAGPWRLTAAQRARLSPVVDAAINAGWAPGELAAHVGANTEGVRSPYAVLATRLSPAELPAPSARSARPPWCGKCNERTRRREAADGADAGRCPACHPLSKANRPNDSGPGSGRSYSQLARHPQEDIASIRAGDLVLDARGDD
jgi:hypothetical protein